jgi:hypothetical protein
MSLNNLHVLQLVLLQGAVLFIIEFLLGLSKTEKELVLAKLLHIF